jgi:transcription elongation factor Elf1
MKHLYLTAKQYVNRAAKTFNCPRCGAPLTAAGNCSQLCGGI